MADGLKRLGFDQVASARVGKVIELELAGDAEGEAGASARIEQLRQMCDKLLANPVIEDYEITFPETPES